MEVGVVLMVFLVAGVFDLGCEFDLVFFGL